MPTKSLSRSTSDDLRPEYDFASLKGGVRGKYYTRATAGATLVLLEPDVADAFPDGPAVNRALRAFLKAEQDKTVMPAGRARRATRPRRTSRVARG